MKKFIILVFLTISMLFVFSLSIFSAEYPNKPIDCIINYNPGGATDLVCRVVGSKAAELLGVPIVFRNMPGAGSLVALEYIYSSNKDGYTYGSLDSGALCSLITSEDIPFGINDFEPIARATIDPVILITQAGRFKDLEDFISQAKENPGKYSYASYGVNIPMHLMEQNQILI